jgi:hypothetical protein
MRILLAGSLLAYVPACTITHHAPYESTVSYFRQSSVVSNSPIHEHVYEGGDDDPAAFAGAPRADGSKVLVLPTNHTDRLSEVVGVVDVHNDMGDEEAALAELRARAAALGADAVLGVEFHHGEAHAGEPTHLSGLAVRFLGGLPERR